ncbi:MAG: formylglycine-generating enzyme family protein [Cyanobacteria bacterium P01_D01_bin.73]
MSKPSTTTDSSGSLRRLKRAIAPVTPKGWELDARDWADTLWLAQFMESGGGSEPPKSGNQRQQNVATQGVVFGQDISTSTRQSVAVFVDERSDKNAQEGEGDKAVDGESEGIPFPMPAADALRSRLDLARALRPLMRKVPSRSRLMLDEAATVERTAEMQGLVVMPVERPQPERWLDLELVVEDSKTTVIWERAIAELQQLMEYQGAFRAVRTWRLGLPKDEKGADIASADLQLFPRWNERRELRRRQRPHNPRELVDPTGRRLILLVTDATSEFWRRGLIYKPLEQWTKQQPVVIVQMFPERLWSRTALADGDGVRFSALEAGMPNCRLVTHGLSELDEVWDEEDSSAVVPVPVVTLEKDSLENWARVVAGCGEVSVPGRSFEAVLAQELAADFVQRQPVELARQQRRTARQRVDLFRSTASPLAQQLAGVMAAAPVSLPVIDLLRQEFVTKAQQHHVAEVLLSGILRRCDDPDDDQCRYKFFGDELRGQEDTSEQQVRMLLLDGEPCDQSYKVLGQLSALITGDSLKTFEAFLEVCDENPESLGEGALPLARVGLSVLEQLGGRYGRIARQFKHVVAPPPPLEPVPPVIPPEPPLEEEFPLIEIEDETAQIEIILERFEFETAKLSQRSRFFGLGSKLVVEKQVAGNWGYSEGLGSKVVLDMMEIPGGSFLVGAPESEPESGDNERPQREITLEPFYMGRFPITQAQWRVVAGYDREDRDLELDPSSFKGDDLPVESVSWDDAVEFCKRLSRRTGKNYQLPSEAQWEYACRAGTTTPFWWGEGIVTDLANYDGNFTYNGCPKGVYREKTTAVGTFPANLWGLHDTHGNVYEWCADHYGSNYSQIPSDGTPWTEGDSSGRRLRGGSWISNPWDCRSAYRYAYSREIRDYVAGFRVCCVAPRASSPPVQKS